MASEGYRVRVAVTLMLIAAIAVAKSWPNFWVIFTHLFLQCSYSYHIMSGESKLIHSSIVYPGHLMLYDCQEIRSKNCVLQLVQSIHVYSLCCTDKEFKSI